MSIVASLGGSLVLGVAALAVAKFWAPPSKPAKAAPTVKLVPVVVASQALAYGAKLEPAKMTLRYVPPDAVPEGAFTAIDQVMSRDDGHPLLLTAVASHEALLPAKVSGPGGRLSVAAQISDGYRAYSVAVTDKSSVGGNALPGDWVDVVLARELPPQAGREMVVSEVVLQNARVLGMDRNVDPASTETAIPATATLEVRLADAQKLALAEKLGTLSLALRKPGSAEVTPVGLIRVSTGGVADASGQAPAAPRAARPRPAQAPLVQAQAPAAPVQNTISIKSGDQRSEVTVPRERNPIVVGLR